MRQFCAAEGLKTDIFESIDPYSLSFENLAIRKRNQRNKLSVHV
jgi:hypothetical protein